MSAALAFSYNSRNWTAFGQFEFPASNDKDGTQQSRNTIAAIESTDSPIVGRGPLNNTDISSAAYHHTYRVFANKTAGALACEAECDADIKCAAWTCVGHLCLNQLL